MSRTILVLEDEAVVAMDMASELRNDGWTILGPAGSVAKAESIVKNNTPDIALLDINLGGSKSYSLARHLLEKNVRVVFLTGYSSSSMPDGFSECLVFSKPVDMRALSSALNKLPLNSTS